MHKIKKLYSDSFQELKVTQNLVFCGMMAALAIVLNYTTTINITQYIRIGFSGLPNRVVEFMFGPAIGAIFGGMLDILKFFLKPDGGASFFGYTLNVMVAGVIYGSILYQKPVRLKRILIAELLVKIIVNCCLNTLWLSLLNGSAFMVILPARILRNLIMLPIDTVIVFFMLNCITRIMHTNGIRSYDNRK